eukprot:TRINITY_DN60882_c0_g2_i1.p1 TRINITY_DN60882_c0_g2~~TRINITY_DN60882_c0_g2_i1.p1  ORF type:complete len:299 (-),score=93.50 TRINITY_DN60882_c0_g2_i1:53-949(-)
MDQLFVAQPGPTARFFSTILRVGFVSAACVAVPASWLLARRLTQQGGGLSCWFDYWMSVRCLCFWLLIPMRLRIHALLGRALALEETDLVAMLDVLLRMCHSRLWRVNRHVGHLQFGLIFAAINMIGYTTWQYAAPLRMWLVTLYDVVTFRMRVDDISDELVDAVAGVTNAQCGPGSTLFLLACLSVVFFMVHLVVSMVWLSRVFANGRVPLRGPRNRSVAPSTIESSTTCIAFDADSIACRGFEECSICLSAYERGDRLRLLPCSHAYHAPCIDEWLYSNGKCPLCQQPISSAKKDQ